MYLGHLILNIEKKFNLTQRQISAIISEEEISLKKYAHLETFLLHEHTKTINLLKVVLLWNTLNILVKKSPYQFDVRKTLFQRFRRDEGKVYSIIQLIQINDLKSQDIELALKAQKLKLNTYHAPELFGKTSVEK